MVEHKRMHDPELRFLACSISGSPPDTAGLPGNSLEEEKLVKLAQHHRVSYLVLKKNPFLPPRVVNNLKKSEQEKLFYRLSLVNTLRGLLAFFNDCQIAVIPYKGAALSHALYGDAVVRDFTDIDILVKEEDVERVYVLLKQYKKELKDIVSYEKNKHSISVKIKEGSAEVEIDIHWRFTEAYFHIDYDMKGLWGRAMHRQLFAVSCLMMCEEDVLLSLTIHHGNMEGWKKLKYLADLHAFLTRRPEINWKLVMDEAQRMDIKKALLTGICLCIRFFETNINEEQLCRELRNNDGVEKKALKIVKKYYVNTDAVPSVFSLSHILDTVLMREKAKSRRLMLSGLLAPHAKDLEVIHVPKQFRFIYPFVKLYRRYKRI